MSMLLKISEVIDGSRLFSEICTSCIYFLISDNEVVYVGQSTSVYARLQAHNNDPKKKWDRFFILPAPIDRLDELELKYYEAFLPKLNRTTPASAAREKRIKGKMEAPIMDFDVDFTEEEKAENERVTKSLRVLLGRTEKRRRRS